MAAGAALLRLRAAFLALALACAGLLMGAGRAPAPEAPAPKGREAGPFGRGAVTLLQGGRRAVLRVEVAATPAARVRGLMERARLPDGAGMLFVYRGAARRTFWMKDTRIPLAIAFIGPGGRVREIARLDPPRPGGPVPAYTSRAPAVWVLEVNRGWFARHGFGPGAQVRYAPEK